MNIHFVRAEVKERVERIPLPFVWGFVACSRVSFAFTFMYFVSMMMSRSESKHVDDNIIKISKYIAQ